MFEVFIHEKNPTPDVRDRATTALTEVMAVQAQFRANDLLARREFLAASNGRGGRSQAALVRAELEIVEQRIVQLMQVRSTAAACAAAELPRLLRLVDSFVEGLELGQGCLAVRMRTGGVTAGHARMLLVPRRERAARVRRQIYAADPPAGLEPSSVPCLGVYGNGYVDDALDRMDLASLVLTFVSHVRTNT